MPFKKGNPYRFTSERQPKRNDLGGRKPSELKTLISLGEVASREDYAKGLSYLRSLSKPELQAVAESNTLPVWITGRARTLYIEVGKGRTDELRDIEDRIFGKARQTTDVTSSDGSLHTPSLVIEKVTPPQE